MDDDNLELNRKYKIPKKNNLNKLYKILIHSNNLSNFSLDLNQLDYKKITKIDEYFIFLEENN
jgi:hypothetical protein